jgi:hypothetical protein
MRRYTGWIEAGRCAILFSPNKDRVEMFYNVLRHEGISLQSAG